MPPRVQVGKAPFVARRPHSSPPSSFVPSAGRARKTKAFWRERRMNGGVEGPYLSDMRTPYVVAVRRRSRVGWPPLDGGNEDSSAGPSKSCASGGRLRLPGSDTRFVVIRGKHKMVHGGCLLFPQRFDAALRDLRAPTPGSGSPPDREIDDFGAVVAQPIHIRFHDRAPSLNRRSPSVRGFGCAERMRQRSFS